MKLFANVTPVQRAAIPWGWKNRKTSEGLVAVNSPGVVRMPELCKFFDWHQYIVEDMSLGLPFGTQNMKSIFATASRLMGWEALLLQQPDLSPITRGFLEWNSRLAAVWDGKLEYFLLGDAIAYAHGLLIRLDWWQSWVKPEYVKMIASARAWGMKVIFRSDGDLWDILDDLAALGIFTLIYQNVGQMKLLGELPLVIAKGWCGRMWKGMLCVLEEDSDDKSLATEETLLPKS